MFLVVPFILVSQAALNAGVYAALFSENRESRVLLHLLVISVMALLAGLPESWGRCVVTEFSRAKWVGVATGLYFLGWAGLSRNPKLGVVGALISVCAGFFILGDRPNTANLAFQVGLAFILVHSLRWQDIEHPGAAAVRGVAAGIWVLHSFIWTYGEETMSWSWAVAAVVSCGYLACRFVSGNWGSRFVPVAAGLVMVSGPSRWMAGTVQTMPTGLLAVAGSFVLFGLGTLAALHKHRWTR